MGWRCGRSMGRRRRHRRKGRPPVVNPWIDVVVFFIAGLTFPLVNLGLSRLFRRAYPYSLTLDPYESGEEPFGDARVSFRIQYYFYAMLFLVFDVEVVFMYPWAVVLRDLGVFGYVVMLLFALTLVEGLVYAYKKGVLRWI